MGRERTRRRCSTQRGIKGNQFCPHSTFSAPPVLGTAGQDLVLELGSSCPRGITISCRLAAVMSVQGDEGFKKKIGQQEQALPFSRHPWGEAQIILLREEQGRCWQRSQPAMLRVFPPAPGRDPPGVGPPDEVWGGPKQPLGMAVLDPFTSS